MGLKASLTINHTTWIWETHTKHISNVWREHNK